MHLSSHLRFNEIRRNISELSRYVFDIFIYLLTAIGLPPGGSSNVHIYTQTIRRTTQLTTEVGRVSGIRTQSGQNKMHFLTCLLPSQPTG
jgi:uncharacterized integral membrane protein